MGGGTNDSFGSGSQRTTAAVQPSPKSELVTASFICSSGDAFLFHTYSAVNEQEGSIG
jgi:hypothetical protein